MVYVDIKGSKHHGEKKGAENALLEVNICWWILSHVCQLLYTNCTLKWPCTIYNNKKFVKFLTQTTCMYKVNRLVLQNWRLLTLVSGCRWALYLLIQVQEPLLLLWKSHIPPSSSVINISKT